MAPAFALLVINHRSHPLISQTAVFNQQSASVMRSSKFLLSSLHVCLKKGQYIVSPYVGCRRAESPVSVLMAAAEGRNRFLIESLCVFCLLPCSRHGLEQACNRQLPESETPAL